MIDISLHPVKRVKRIILNGSIYSGCIFRLSKAKLSLGKREGGRDRERRQHFYGLLTI